MGCIDELVLGKPQASVPYRRVDEKNKLSILHVGQPAVAGEHGRQQGAHLAIQGIEPQGSAQRVARLLRQRGLQGLTRGGVRCAGTRF